ncbi:hypothetical protein EJ02DRAFT_188633 [Clathrospora elynae]|uniref:Uncharacterized protein n=1 Tax=Clathrospora elynae TaxID=706981 RepID=A0A6A5SP27_9PLEO|nr:hypothetical protein EJ02DRAFT_188633 [Clathrospora elynae]
MMDPRPPVLPPTPPPTLKAPTITQHPRVFALFLTTSSYHKKPAYRLLKAEPYTPFNAQQQSDNTNPWNSIVQRSAICRRHSTSLEQYSAFSASIRFHSAPDTPRTTGNVGI